MHERLVLKELFTDIFWAFFDKLISLVSLFTKSRQRFMFNEDIAAYSIQNAIYLLQFLSHSFSTASLLRRAETALPFVNLQKEYYRGDNLWKICFLFLH